MSKENQKRTVINFSVATLDVRGKKEGFIFKLGGK